MKHHPFYGRQQGFTLLELLVVIVLLAVLSVGALVAYEGIGENAQDTAAANNIKTADGMIRNFRAVEGVFPNQWDNLANLEGDLTGGTQDLLADATKAVFGQWTTGAADAVFVAVAKALNDVGIDELQTLQDTSTFGPDNVPNLAFNESNPAASADPASELEFESDGAAATAEYDGAAAPAAFALSILPSGAAGTCDVTTAGNSIADTFDGTTLTTSANLNLINDGLDDDLCHLVVAVGFGKDVPGTTLDSRVAISTAPTYTSNNVNPSQNYARYIALFHVASDDEDAPDGLIEASEVLAKPRLIAVVDTEGRTVDASIAGANATN